MSAYDWERDEARAARRHTAGPCYGPHRMTADRAGGGVCTVCGITVNAEEI